MPTVTSSSATATDVAVIVRPVAASDVAAIHRIYAHEVLHGTATYEYAVPDLVEMERRVAAVVGAGYPFLVGDQDGAVVAYAHASAYRGREGYRWTIEDSVYVDAAHQGRGAGRTLLDALIRQCTALGYRQMIAVVGDATNAASIALHERLGFRIAARFPGLGRKHGRWLENVQMQRPLGDGAGGDPLPPLPVDA